MAVNKQYDEKALFELLNCPQQYKKQASNHENDLVNRYITFYDMIFHFGIGMVIFPSIIQSLGGTASVSYFNNNRPDASSDNVKIDGLSETTS